MEKKKILVIGNFGYRTNQLDGQTVKTRNIYELLLRNKQIVDYYDTQDYQSNPFSLFVMIWKLINIDTLILIPCVSNLTYFFPFSFFLSKIFRFNIIHICVGGWQLEYFKGNEKFKKHNLQLKLSKKIKVFMPQTESVTYSLIREFSFKNIETLNNFRIFKYEKTKIYSTSKLKLVFMARINMKKGYDTIFNFLDFAKDNNLDVIVDFYGPIELEYKSDFENKLHNYKDVANYKGILNGNEIYTTLSKYDLLLLPTKFYTEGFPGSILDAYISGIPVLVTKWKYALEFVENNKTGFIVSFDNCQDEFNERILSLYNDRNMLERMKKYAREESNKYSFDSAWQTIKKYL